MKYLVKVTAIPEKGFRRAGFAFTREATTITVDADQLKQIQKESLLVCQILEEIPPVDDSKPQRNVAETIKLVMAADSAGLAALTEGETRKGVMDAIAKRTVELCTPE